MQTIIYSKKAAIAHIKLNRPEVLNALNEPMLAEIKMALIDAESDSAIKVVLVSGEGKAFSAGVDLKTTSADGFKQGGSFMTLGQEVSNLFTKHSKVTIAQVHGYCFTGALEMMMFFDMAFCTEDTQFGDTHAKWAIIPAWGMSQRLSRRVGLAKAKELTFRAMRIKGLEAERIGLVNRAFKKEDLVTEVQNIIEEITSNSFEAIAAIKKLYDQGYETTLKEGLNIELNADFKLENTDDMISDYSKKKFRSK